jgi:hypothetical protein
MDFIDRQIYESGSHGIGPIVRKMYWFLAVLDKPDKGFRKLTA